MVILPGRLGGARSWRHTNDRHAPQQRRPGDCPSRATPAAAVLADRLAAALVHHEPGWQLPRLSTLARQYNVSSAEIDAAIDNLAARHLVRRLPDGQLSRTSPAEYWLPLEGIPGLAPRVHPIGGQLLCVSSHPEMRRTPEDIGRTLGAAPSDPVLSIRCVWTVGGEPAAVASSYVSEKAAAKLGALRVTKPGDDDAAQGYHEHTGAWSPLAFPIPRQPGDGTSMASRGTDRDGPATPFRGENAAGPGRSVRDHGDPELPRPHLRNGSSADHSAMLRPELFRIVVEAPPRLTSCQPSSTTSQVTEGTSLVARSPITRLLAFGSHPNKGRARTPSAGTADDRLSSHGACPRRK